ncbi:RidA family protein [Sphingomonas crocodyli]|uniref:RidA family protein n=1 Tax=Sphingomonas crocodyli TaxID=1979270 RepID=A0A437M5V7_9SPHN|nr:RidA family protein [Sphingomonas crocodyli]RVT92935.1 RidA family protein [Sphingomonas crocodyli]
MDITRIVTNARRGRAVVYNGVVYVGGQTASDKDADIKGQTEETLAKIDKVLRDAGTDKSRLLTAQIWMKDIARDFSEMNAAWDAWVEPDAFPTRATTQCSMANSATLVEIIVTAAIGSD